MIQSWILIDNGIMPVENLKQKKDFTICGNCIHRSGSCYVNVGQAPNAVYRAYLRGLYPKYDAKLHSKYFTGKVMRFGSYGDPSCIEYAVWNDLSKLLKSWTGYTHQWRNPRFNYLRFLCMASVETETEVKEANKLGFRSFRVKSSFEKPSIDEFVCPASAEAGKKKTCFECKACRGYNIYRPKVPNVVINAHGLDWKIKKYDKLLIQTKENEINKRIALTLI